MKVQFFSYKSTVDEKFVTLTGSELQIIENKTPG